MQTDTLKPLLRAHPTKGGPEMLKKIVAWGLVAFVIFYIAYSPGNAAQVVRSLGGGLSDIATGIGNFFSDLANS